MGRHVRRGERNNLPKGFRRSRLQTYLAEEAEALAQRHTLATADKKSENLSPSLTKLKKLNDEGFTRSVTF